MDVEIYFNGIRLQAVIQEGRSYRVYLTNGSHIGLYSVCKHGCQVVCPDCGQIRSTRNIRDILRKNNASCFKCSQKTKKTPLLGGHLSEETKEKIRQKALKRFAENGHPSLGRKQSEETKQKISKANSGKYLGCKSCRYGKKHSDESRKKMSESQKGKHIGKNNHFYGKTHTAEAKEKIKESNRKFRENNPEAWENQKRKCAKKALERVNDHKFGISSIEIKTREYLTGCGIQHKYNFILDNKYQYDFLIEGRIVLEVHGDYWHANPNKYGPGKRAINETQKHHSGKDALKKDYAESKGYIYYFIWETDIRKKDWSKLEEIIKNEKIQTNSNTID